MSFTLIIIYIIIAIAIFLFMEGVAWFTHKYIMHGILWSWHKSHHIVRKGAFEKNDLFSVVFSIPAIIAFYIGTQDEQLQWLIPIGIGITAYGIFYFSFHDIIVHRRVQIKFKAKNKYLKRMIRAHYIHHSVHSKDGAEAFGFLYAPKKYEGEKLSQFNDRKIK